MAQVEQSSHMQFIFPMQGIFRNDPTIMQLSNDAQDTTSWIDTKSEALGQI
jgi:hypothetical protein